MQSIDRTVTGRDSALEGVVTVGTPDIFAHQSLFPDVAKLARQFPNIKLNVDLSYGIADLSKREADIAVRVINEPPEDLVGRKVGEFCMAAYTKSGVY